MLKINNLENNFALLIKYLIQSKQNLIHNNQNYNLIFQNCRLEKLPDNLDELPLLSRLDVSYNVIEEVNGNVFNMSCLEVRELLKKNSFVKSN